MMLPDPTYVIELDVFKCRDFLTSKTPPVLIDCREIDEYDHCRINGSVLIPLSNFLVALEAKYPSEKFPVLVYCHHGVRSLRAVQHLREKGFSQSYSMAGGIDQWSLLIDTSILRY